MFLVPETMCTAPCKKQGVRGVVERSVVGGHDRIGLHVMDVADRFVDLGHSVDLRLSAVSVEGSRARRRPALAGQAAARRLANRA